MAADLSPMALRVAQASNDPALGSQEEASAEDSPGHFDAGPLPDDELATQSPVTPEPSTYRFEYPEGNAGDAENRRTVDDENADRETPAHTNDDAPQTATADIETPCRQTSDPEPAASDEPDKGVTTGEETPDHDTTANDTADEETADCETADDETSEDVMTDEKTPDNDSADDDTNRMADDPTGDDVPAEEETADPEMADDQPAEEETADPEMADDQQAEEENLQDDCADDEEAAEGEDDAEGEDGDDAAATGDGDRCAGEDQAVMTEPELPPAQPEAPIAEPESPSAQPEAPDASLNAEPTPTPYGGDFGYKYGNRYGYKYGYEDSVSGPQYGEPGSVAPQTETQTEPAADADNSAGEQATGSDLPSQERDASIDETSGTSRAPDAVQDLAQPPVETADAGQRGGDARATLGLLADVFQRVVLRAANGTVGTLWNASRDLAGTEWGTVLRGWTGGRVVNPWGRVELWIPR